jgi:hypothetical protein
MRISFGRTVLAVVSALLLAWFVVLARDERVGSDGGGRILHSPGMSNADWRRSLDQLRQAELLNPGSDWKTTRAGALLLRDKRAARQLLEEVLQAEPDNLAAWRLLLTATRTEDPARAARARREIERLNGPMQLP